MSWTAPMASVASSVGQVIFFDDFLGSTLDTSKWVALDRDGDQSNSELQWYLPANVTVSGSNLNITCQVQTHNTRSYTSGMIQWPHFTFRYGTVEARILMTGGQGPWPGSVWHVGSNCQISNQTDASNIGLCNWPAPGSSEIDMAEVLSSDHTSVWQNLFNTGGNVNLNAGGLSDTSLNWHVYKVVWTPTSVTWYVDGNQTNQSTAVASISQTSMFQIVNVAVGGSGGTVTDGTLPQTMKIDYIKVTQG